MSKNYTEKIQTLFTYREEIHKDLVTRLSFYAFIKSNLFYISIKSNILMLF